MEQNIFAVGDIHGCLDKLRALMKRLPLNPGDLVVFLGDYIDRGPDTRGVLDYLLGFRARHPKTVFLMGNHEHLLLEYSRTGDAEDLRALRGLGVEATLESYGADVASLRDLSFMPVEHVHFLQELAPFHRQGEWLFVHAGVPEGCAPEDCPLERILSIRGTFLSTPWEGSGTVVFGHTSFETPFVMRGKIGIDTGAAKGNLLTAVELPARRFHHA